MIFEVAGYFIVQSDTFGSDPVFGQDFVAVTETPDQFFGLARLDGGCMDVIGIIVIHDKQVFVSTCRWHGPDPGGPIGCVEFIRN